MYFGTKPKTCTDKSNKHLKSNAADQQQPPRWHAWWHNHQLFPQTMMKNRPDRCRFNSQRKRKIQRKRQKSRKEGGVQQLQGTRKARRKAQCSANWTIPSICKKRMKRKTREDEGQASDTRLVSGKRGILKKIHNLYKNAQCWVWFRTLCRDCLQFPVYQCFKLGKQIWFKDSDDSQKKVTKMPLGPTITANPAG